MVVRATITVDLAKITQNAKLLGEMLPGVEIVGVTKVTCGTPDVAAAMLAGGATAIGESRLENIVRLRAAGIEAPYWLLRASPPALAAETVRLADVSLVSERVCAEALDAAAVSENARHGVVAMIDLGDLREGMLPHELPEFLDAVARLKNLDLLGIGTSLTCYGGVVPDEANLGELARLAHLAEERFGRPMVVSGGMSSTIDAALGGYLPSAVDNLRLGESIVLGVSTVTREPLPGLHTDSVVVEAPVIECKRKPSVPLGRIAQDAFGNVPSFTDRGERLRAICAIGRQDAPPGGLQPLDSRVEVLGASSDHLILDVEDLPEPPRIGESISFIPTYAAALALFTSHYVDKRFIGGE
ncbi:MAG: alanine/ornithine racemase family PLP-dependent enzyme [Coriobacteriia bacterium]|jgi:predicted amino acid racemase|nr:alanine/ornithine racemase family PLP-dependent enzyme [Coriobacteriia bacterium]